MHAAHEATELIEPLASHELAKRQDYGVGLRLEAEGGARLIKEVGGERRALCACLDMVKRMQSDVKRGPVNAH